jgi:adenosylmethionine-8-amino-7-oxononanoate aminotransferase
MKLTRQYFVDISQPERIHFIARKGAFHGTTLGSLSLTEKIGIRSPFGPLLITDHVSFVSTPNIYRGKMAGESTEEYSRRLIEEARAEFQRIGTSKVGAFVAETFTGSVSKCSIYLQKSC